MEKITLQDNINALSNPPGVKKQAPDSSLETFSTMIKGSLEEVNQLQNTADNAVRELAAGKEADLHQTMIAMEKADISFQLLMQVRNKIIAAYQEIMRMQF